MTDQNFKALRVSEVSEHKFESNIINRSINDLPDNEVLIEVLYSSVNYKDALSASGNKGVTRKYPHTPGIDAAGIVVSSKTDKFHPGDEVIVPDATWIASAAPIIYLGATPIFADINPKTWCISYDTIKPLINKKTKAIIAVNLYGNMPEYDDLKKIGLPIIEDGAESLGSKYNNIMSGKFGITSCFSFHGTKTVTTGAVSYTHLTLPTKA